MSFYLNCEEFTVTLLLLLIFVKILDLESEVYFFYCRHFTKQVHVYQFNIYLHKYLGLFFLGSRVSKRNGYGSQLLLHLLVLESIGRPLSRFNMSVKPFTIQNKKKTKLSPFSITKPFKNC